MKHTESGPMPSTSPSILDDFGPLVETADGSFTVKLPDADECYHSHAGANLEAETLYIQRSDFIQILTASSRPLTVLDVGLGLGFNAMATISAWQSVSSPTDLTVVSLEVNPRLVSALQSGQAPWQCNWSQSKLHICQSLEKESELRWQTHITHANGATLRWQILIGDAREVDLNGFQFDFVWQDPFSPATNPNMWNKEWFSKVRASCHKQVTLMTYSVARQVRDNLASAGWHWQKIPGSGGKKHWLRANLESKGI